MNYSNIWHFKISFSVMPGDAELVWLCHGVYMILVSKGWKKWFLCGIHLKDFVFPCTTLAPHLSHKNSENKQENSLNLIFKQSPLEICSYYY